MFATWSNLPEVAGRLQRMADVAAVETAALLERSALGVKQAAVLEIAAHTPFDASHEGEHLGATTQGETILEGASAVITIRQTKTVPWKGQDYPLARFLIDGTDPHVIEAPPGHALFWEGADHPVKRVNHPGFPGRDYPAEAMGEAMPGITAMLAADADAVAHTVVRSLVA